MSNNSVPTPGNRIFTTYHLPNKPLVIGDKECQRSWPGAIAHWIGKASLVNAFSSHVKVSQESAEEKVTFTATRGFFSRALSLASTALMVFLGRFIGRARKDQLGLALGALAPLGLSVGVGLWKKFGAKADHALLAEQQTQYGASTSYADLKTKNPEVIAANIKENVEPLMNAALKQGIMGWLSGSNYEALKVSFENLVKEGGAGDLATWLCSHGSSNSEGMKDIRVLLGDVIKEYINGNASRIDQVMPLVAKAKVNPNPLRDIVSQVVAGVSPLVVKQTLSACEHCPAEVAAAAFEAVVNRRDVGGALDAVVTHFTAPELLQIAPQLGLNAQLEFITAVAKRDVYTTGDFQGKLQKACESVITKVGGFEDKSSTIKPLADLFNALKDDNSLAGLGALKTQVGKTLLTVVAGLPEQEPEAQDTDSVDVTLTQESFYGSAADAELRAIFRITDDSGYQAKVFELLNSRGKKVAINAVSSTSGALNGQKALVQEVLKTIALNVKGNVSALKQFVDNLANTELRDIDTGILTWLYSFAKLANVSSDQLGSLENHMLSYAQTDEAASIAEALVSIQGLQSGQSESAYPIFNESQMNQLYMAFAPDAERVEGFGKKQEALAPSLVNAHVMQLHSGWTKTLAYVLWNYDQTAVINAILGFFGGLSAKFTATVAEPVAEKIKAQGNDFRTFVESTIAQEAGKEVSEYEDISENFAPILEALTVLDAPAEPDRSAQEGVRDVSDNSDDEA